MMRTVITTSLDIPRPRRLIAKIADKSDAGKLLGFVVPPIAPFADLLARSAPGLEIIAGVIWREESEASAADQVAADERRAAGSVIAAINHLLLVHGQKLHDQTM